MIQIKALKISFDYSREFDPHNHDLVGYVVQKYPRKVVKASILTRSSVESWYDEVSSKYEGKNYVFLLGTVSLIGTVLGLATEDDFSEDEVESHDTKYRARSKAN